MEDNFIKVPIESVTSMFEEYFCKIDHKGLRYDSIAFLIKEYYNVWNKSVCSVAEHYHNIYLKRNPVKKSMFGFYKTSWSDLEKDASLRSRELDLYDSLGEIKVSKRAKVLCKLRHNLPNGLSLAVVEDVPSSWKLYRQLKVVYGPELWEFFTRLVMASDKSIVNVPSNVLKYLTPVIGGEIKW